MGEMRGRLQGTPIKDKDGNTVAWRVRVQYTTATGAKAMKGFERKTQKAAQDAAIEWLAQHGRVALAPDTGTVSEAIKLVDRDLWSKHRGENTRSDYLRCARIFEKEFGERLLADITAPQLTQYFKRFVDGSKRMMNEHWKVANAVFAYAASDLGWITSNPMDLARKPKATGPGREWPTLSREQFNKILPHLGKEHRLFYRLLGETGARPSEAWGLDTGERLDFLRDIYWFVIERGKTEAATRRVPIGDQLARDLEAAGPKPFPTIAGMKDPIKHLGNHWRKAMTAAEIPYSRPYEVRAMRINEWRMAQVPDDVRRKIVGHTSIETTHGWYDSVSLEEIKRALGVGDAWIDPDSSE